MLLEVAVGTGKLTRLLLAAAQLHLGPHHFCFVEPAAAMRHKFEQLLGRPCEPGTAAHLPYADQLFDAVFIGQAFHWFANDESLCELSRVMKPGASLHLLWNLEDNSVPWIARLRSLYEKVIMSNQFRCNATHVAVRTGLSTVPAGALAARLPLATLPRSDTRNDLSPCGLRFAPSNLRSSYVQELRGAA